MSSSKSRTEVKEEGQTDEASRQAVLRLKPERRVHWDGSVIDNEHLNKKKSNKCCIFHAHNEADVHSPCSSQPDADKND